MSRPSFHQQLDRTRVLQMLTDLGAHMKERGLIANVQIVGGAAIALTLKDERFTQDVDAVFDHYEDFLAASYNVAESHGVQHDWIADDVADFVSQDPIGEPVELAIDGLNCYVASPEHLLAMKVRAATVRVSEKDSEDLVFLAEHLELTTPRQVADLTKRQFEGLYRDQIGYDEYLATARDAFLVADLLAGRDPLARMTTSTEGEDSDNEVEYTSDQGFSYEDLHN